MEDGEYLTKADFSTSFGEFPRCFGVDKLQPAKLGQQNGEVDSQDRGDASWPSAQSPKLGDSGRCQVGKATQDRDHRSYDEQFAWV